MDELETLFVTLGMKTDDPSVDASVKEMIKTLQKKLNSSIYGGENGVITLPATIEGTFKNGKEIDKQIKDAYAAIYEKAKQMADESVSLTLDDIKSFKTQIDKFGKKTAKYKSSDIIANANNNLRQTLSGYQDFINDLRKQVSIQQKAQIKQEQKARAQQKAKSKQTTYHGITDEEINDAIVKENERQAKIKAWRDKQAEQVASKLDYRSGSIDASRTNKKESMASEFSEYSSNWARELAKTIKETYSKELTKHIFDKDFVSDQPKGRLSRATTKEEYLNHLSTKAIRALGGLIGEAEHGSKDVTFDKIVEAIGLVRTIFEENGKSMATIAQSIATATQSRYDQPQDTQPDDHSDRKKIYKKDRYEHRIGGIDAEEGAERGVGKGHKQTQEYQRAIQQLLKNMLGEVDNLNKKEEQVNKVTARMVASQYEQYKQKAQTSDASKETKRLADEIKGEKTRDERSYVQDIRESSAERQADAAEAQKNQQMIDIQAEDKGTGFNTDANATPVAQDVKEIKNKVKREKKSAQDETEKPVKKEEPKKEEITSEQLKNAITNPLAEGKCPCEEILNSIQKTLNAINGNTDIISKKLNTKKTEEKKVEKVEKAETVQKTNSALALDIHRDKFGKQDQFIKTIPFDSFSPKGLSKKELDTIRINKQLTLATEKAIEKNKSKQVDNPSVMDVTGTNFNKLAPIIVDTVKNTVAGVGVEAIGKGKKDIVGSTVDIPEWKKAEQAIANEAQRIKEEEEARKRLADQITLETNMAKQRNAKKLQPVTPATIKLEGEAEKEIGNSIQDTLKRVFGKITGESEASRQLNLSERDRARETAARMKKYGKPRGRGEAGDLGVVSDIRYSKNLWRGKDAASSPNDPLFRDIRKTDPIDGIDVNKVMEALQKAIENNMFSAQTGGGWKSAMAASLTGGLAYAFQPSMEKTRAEVDGLNTVMADVRNKVLTILEDIKGKQATLGEMQQAGDIKFDDQNRQISGTPEATALFNELENSKDVLESLLAEMGNVDAVIKECGGDVSKIIQKLGFVMPELRKENVILKNIGAGLDKNGKALKYQTRMGEVLNYSFQLMARHIGQMVKNWLMMINPLNLIKRAFSDFASYDVKWKRTLNVIKYNLRRIIRPAMEWIAQQIVNIIGLVNALMKGIGKVFNQNWDLFDQAAAATEQMHEELEAAANVSAGFDELHDIGGESSTPEGDLFGDIYTPQWDGLNKLLEKIGETIGNIIKAVSGWTFWDWLKLAGAALAGYLVLKWLIGIFTKGKNPLQTVAEGFSFLEKAVGWAILIWAFTEFTKALTDFVECMKTADWEDIVKSLLMLGGAFSELFLAAGGLMYLATALGLSAPALIGVAAIVGSLTLFTNALTNFIECMKSASWEDIVKSLLMLAGAFAALVLAGGGLMFIASALGMLAPQMLGLAVVIAAFAPVIWALSAFVEAIKGLTSEDMLNGLLFLAGAFMAIAVAIGVLLVVLSAAIASGVGALAILALAGILAVVALVIVALAELVRAMGEAGAGIKLICEGIATIIQSIGEAIMGIVDHVASAIATVIQAIADGIVTVLQPIMDFMDSVIDKVVDLAKTIVKEIGKTIRDVIKTVGDVVLGIIDKIVNAVPNLLKSIVDFCHDIGPAIENTVDAICRSVTKLVNFIVSAVEYLANLVIGAINKFSIQVPDWVPGIGGTRFGFNLQPIEIPRFVPKYEQGTNYVPNDGLAYLHQGEAVIPKKYNTPYQQGMSTEERAYMQQMMVTMRSLDNTMKQGIPVNGEFRQRGSDLVAVVDKNKSRIGADLLSNVAYAR